MNILKTIELYTLKGEFMTFELHAIFLKRNLEFVLFPCPAVYLLGKSFPFCTENRVRITLGQTLPEGIFHVSTIQSFLPPKILSDEFFLARHLGGT